jgi:hypothetical protein
MRRAAAWILGLAISLSAAGRAGDMPVEFVAGMDALGNGDHSGQTG